ncbi:MAG: Spy/CpxP family protein refolding chaperone [Candidatus Omnitrophica bacterium]|nr:Spy/CpxP family protein refolding chaperone [Candidatus Omnitrophota bacterium]MDD5436665.1 Spy/CpxP family protein refolding chaperone [Candidatus Omnitrophota bacterium]
MKIKKVITLLVITAFVLSSGIGYVYAGDKCTECGKNAKGNVGVRQEKLYKALNLTDEQKKMLEENKTKNTEQMKATFDQIKEKKNAMREELQKATLDMGKITQINNDLKKLESDMLDQRLQSILGVRHILSPEQFKKFSEKMKEHKGHQGRRGSSGGNRD